MNKVKLTKAQLDAINKALSHYGDAAYLVDIHRKMMNQGHEWSIWTALNDLSPDVLNHALKYGYEVDEGWSPAKLDKYGAVFKADVLDFLNNNTSYNERKRLFEDHKERMESDGVWIGYRIFNDISISEMADALGIDPVVDEQSSPLAPRKIHPIVVLVRKEKAQELTQKALEAELDYELASLYDAMQQGDQVEIERSKKRLAELHKELDLEPVLEGF